MADVGGRMPSAIQSLYTNVISCVKFLILNIFFFVKMQIGI